MPNNRTSNPISTGSRLRTGEVGLRRIVGVSFGLAVVVGGMIGIGILRTPSSVARWISNPTLSLALWAVAGAYILINALCLAELATAFPRAGGPYVFARRAFGDFTGFVVGWVDWALNTAALAFLAVAFVDYSVLLVPAVGAHRGIAASTLIVALAAVNGFSLHLGAAIQQALSAVKALTFLALIVGCFVLSDPHPVASLALTGTVATLQPLVPAVGLAMGIALSLQAILETYGGWNVAVYFAEEDRDPQRNLARSLIGGVLTVTAIYLLTNAALFHVLSVAEIASTKIPAALAAERSFGAHGGGFLTALALVSLLAIANTQMLFVPRILYGMGRDGLFSARGATLNRYGTPSMALLTTAAIAIVLTLSGTFDALFAAVSFLNLCINVALVGALFALRRRSGTEVRPYSVPLYPWLPAIAMAGSLATLAAFLVSNTLNSLISIGAMLLSYPVWQLLRRANA